MKGARKPRAAVEDGREPEHRLQRVEELRSAVTHGKPGADLETSERGLEDVARAEPFFLDHAEQAGNSLRVRKTLVKGGGEGSRHELLYRDGRHVHLRRVEGTPERGGARHRGNRTGAPEAPLAAC